MCCSGWCPGFVCHLIQCVFGSSSVSSGMLVGCPYDRVLSMVYGEAGIALPHGKFDPDGPTVAAMYKFLRVS